MTTRREFLAGAIALAVVQTAAGGRPMPHGCISMEPCGRVIASGAAYDIFRATFDHTFKHRHRLVAYPANQLAMDVSPKRMAQAVLDQGVPERVAMVWAQEGLADLFHRTVAEAVS